MSRKLILPALTAALVIGCLLASSQLAEGQKRKSRTAKVDDTAGKDWRVLRDALDETFETLQQDEGIIPAPITDDSTFLRRVYIDLTGAPPSPEEIAAFAPGHLKRKQTQQEKREALVEQLLASPEFNDHMATWWATLLSERVGYANMSYQPLHTGFQNNIGWDTVVRNLMMPEPPKKAGRSTVNLGYYAGGYFQQLTYLQDFGYLAGTPVKVFLGRQIGCAECHDHPYDDFTQDDFEAWGGFFKTFVRAQKSGDETYLRITGDIPFKDTADLERQLQLTGKYKLPRYLDGTEWRHVPGKTPRQQMVEWMTSPENPWFREMTVNRYMDYFLGIGFVTPVDDFNALNDVTIPVILRVMGKDFADSGFDSRRLIRAIVNSRLYQRMAAPNLTNADDRMLYSRQQVREMTPEMMERTIMKVTGIERLNPPRSAAGRRQAQTASAYGYGSAYRMQIRAMLREAYEGDPVVKDVDDRNGNPMRALLFMNADLLPKGQKSTLTEILRRTQSKSLRGELIFQTVLGRYPTEREKEILDDTFVKWGGGEEAYEDLFVALMNTSEFFNRS